MDQDDLDVIIVGAGISGIAAGHYLRKSCPDRSFAILEGRDAIGGTWDLFRYPGVRSDSDMFTLGFSFRPWVSDHPMAEGGAIREYVRATAREEGLEAHIRFGQRVTQASWNTGEARWTVTVQGAQGERSLRCRFLFFCSGYYDYAQGHDPDWPGRADFRGRIVHPQHWPEGLELASRRVVVIGSGATAVSLLPAVAAQAAHVTLLQRTPSYILSLPARDEIGVALQRWLPARLAYRLVRWKNIAASNVIFQLARRRPTGMRRWLIDQARRQLPPAFDARHLEPPYAPWDQRLCFVPGGDLFRVLASDRASVMTDDIEAFTATGLRLRSGAEVPADVVITATGLKLQMLGGARLTVDGEAVDLASRVAYRGILCSGVPNLALAIGYTNASWTLRAEMVARYVCRLLNRMRARGDDICLPVPPPGLHATRPAIDLTSGYVQRAAAVLPRQGDHGPWRIVQNYWREWPALRWGPMADGFLRFTRAGRPGALPGEAPAAVRSAE